MSDLFYPVLPAGKDLAWSKTVALSSGDSAAFSIPDKKIAGVLAVTVASAGAWNAKYAVDDAEGDGQSVGGSKALASGTATASALIPIGATSLIVACTSGTVSIEVTFSFSNYTDRHVADVSVKKFGAVGDGVTDDSAAFQSAINSGLPLYVPSGTYYIPTTLDVPENGMNIRGAGKDATTLRAKWDTTEFVDGEDDTRIIGSTTIFKRITAASNITIRDMTISGSMPADFDEHLSYNAGAHPEACNPLFYFKSITNLVMHNLKFRDWDTNAYNLASDKNYTVIFVRGCTHVELTGCEETRCQSEGISFWQSNDINVSDFWAHDNPRISTPLNVSSRTDETGCNGIRLRDLVIDGSGGSALNVNGSDIEIDGFDIRNNTRGGIDLGGEGMTSSPTKSKNVIIKNGIIKDAYGTRTTSQSGGAIYVQADNVSISDVVIENEEIGVYARYCTNVSIKNVKVLTPVDQYTGAGGINPSGVIARDSTTVSIDGVVVVGNPALSTTAVLLQVAVKAVVRDVVVTLCTGNPPININGCTDVFIADVFVDETGIASPNRPGIGDGGIASTGIKISKAKIVAASATYLLSFPASTVVSIIDCPPNTTILGTSQWNDVPNITRLAAAEVTQTLWDFAKARQLPTNLLREMVESASMGMFTVIVDDLGYPSMMMVCRPVMGGHIHVDFGGTTYPDDVFPSHLVGGVFKPEIYLAPFNAREYTDGSGARAVVWPGLFPTTSKTFDQEKTLCTAKGSGWHMMTFWENAYLTWMSMKNNTEPRGNTYYGRSHEAGYEFESGVRADLLFPGTASGTAATRGGSGPSSWSHNRERWGIHDLVGNVWRRLDGMKIVDGLIYLPDDNNYALAEASWPAVHGSSAQAVYFDNTVATTGGAPRLSSARDNALVDPNSSTVAHSAMTMTTGYDALDVTARRKMLKSGLAMRLTQAESNPFGPKGAVYLKNYGERLPLAGSDWTLSSSAGLAALSLSRDRLSASNGVGFRPSYIP